MNSQMAASARWKANSSMAASTSRRARSSASRTAASSAPGGPGAGTAPPAEFTGEIGIQATHERYLAEVGVQAEGHLPQQEVAEGVEAVLVRELEGLHHVADGLGHLPAAIGPVAVDVEPPVEGDAGRLEH